MGRTNPTFRDVLRDVRQRWQPFRRGLRREDQARFDDLLEKAGAHADAAGYANPADPTALVVLSILLEQQAEIDALAERVAAAEDRLGRVEDRPSRVEDSLAPVEDRLGRAEDRLAGAADRPDAGESERADAAGSEGRAADRPATGRDGPATGEVEAAIDAFCR